VVNAEVDVDYRRVDLAVHVGELAAEQGLTGPGVGLLTAADVARWCREDGGVVVDATVGIRQPTWAAEPDDRGDPGPAGGAPSPGTINLVAQLPVPLDPAALVNAVVTVTEAKSQALLEGGVPGTGTASDAVCVLCPPAGPGVGEPFGGPRSRWGARLARAAHAAVRDGLQARVDAGRRA
jgi:adenosylcobinamide amidohydrolase